MGALSECVQIGKSRDCCRADNTKYSRVDIKGENELMRNNEAISVDWPNRFGGFVVCFLCLFDVTGKGNSYMGNWDSLDCIHRFNSFHQIQFTTQ